MLTHLHVHLEPNQRKRRMLGVADFRAGGSARFFADVSLGCADRLPVDLADLRNLLTDLHHEQRDQGVGYVETRLAPYRFLLDGARWPDFLTVADETVRQLAEPTVRLILLLNRDDPAEFVELLEGAILAGLPDTVVGIDVAGDERQACDITRFKQCCGYARSAGLGVTIHAGEFGIEGDVWAALDVLGATRIGHGVAIGRSRALTRRLSQDRVLVEVSLSSNMALGAISRLNEHPLPKLLDNGVPACLNTDIPVYLNTDLAYEYHLAARLLGDDSGWFEVMADCARRHAFSRN